jgi:hypothetical protein
MRMKNYAVKIHYSGTNTYFVSAPDYEEAEDVACEEFQNDIGDLGQYTEITDIESEEDSDDE